MITQIDRMRKSARIVCVAATALLQWSRAVCAQESAHKWIRLFNGRDLNDWVVKIAGHDVGDNYARTFRVDSGLLETEVDRVDRVASIVLLPAEALFLHGGGEEGNDLSLVSLHGPVKEVKNGRELPFVIISPQTPYRQWWKPQLLNDLLKEAVAKYRVDEDRLYLTGLSRGGYGSWAMATAYPERFAAVAAICGGGDPRDAARRLDRALVECLAARRGEPRRAASQRKERPADPTRERREEEVARGVGEGDVAPGPAILGGGRDPARELDSPPGADVPADAKADVGRVAKRRATRARGDLGVEDREAAQRSDLDVRADRLGGHRACAREDDQCQDENRVTRGHECSSL